MLVNESENKTQCACKSHINLSDAKNEIKKVKARGTRQEVWSGQANRTNGGLKKEDLMLNGKNQIVSKRASEQKRNLLKLKPNPMFQKNIVK